jgi:hypothetical protein
MINEGAAASLRPKPKTGSIRIMTPEGSLLEEIKLANGLSLFIYDQSRPLAGDRWLVKLLLFIPVRVRPQHFSHIPDAEKAYAAFADAVGDNLAMQQERLRIFIDRDAVSETLRQIKEEVLATTLAYVSNSDFEARFVAKRYREWSEELRTEQARIKSLN